MFCAVSPYLESALAEGGDKDWLLPDIREMMAKDQIDVWALLDEFGAFGGAVSVLRQFSRRRVIDILLLGTEPHREADWMLCLEQLRNLAADVGATAITGTGRPGWARKLGATEHKVFEIHL